MQNGGVAVLRTDVARKLQVARTSAGMYEPGNALKLCMLSISPKNMISKNAKDMVLRARVRSDTSVSQPLSKSDAFSRLDEEPAPMSKNIADYLSFHFNKMS